MSCLALNPYKGRVLSGILFLEGGHELEGMGRNHAVVMIGGKGQGGRVIHACLDVVQGGILDQVVEALQAVAGAVIGCPGPADGKLMIPQHIHNTDLGNSHPEQFGSLGHNRSNQKSAIGTSHDRKLIGGSIFLGDQVFGSGNKIIKYILLLFLDTGFMPFFPVLSPTPEVGNGINTATFQEYQAAYAEGRRKADVESAISV